MSEKHYDNDWAKAKSRDLNGEMLDDTILTFRDPKEVKVIHFGGNDLAEAKQVYLPRGILPQNIISLERKAENAKKQEALKTGIKVVPKSLEQFLADPRNVIDFDVASIDYTGPITNRKLHEIKELCRRQQRRFFILHVANLLSREDSDIYFDGISASESPATQMKEKQYLEELKARIDNINEVAKRLDGEEPLGELKIQAYANLVRSTFSGLSERTLETELRYLSGKEYEDALFGIGLSIFQHTGDNITLDPNAPMNVLKRDGTYRMIFENYLRELYKARMKDQNLTNPEVQAVLVNAIRYALKDESGHIEKAIKQYSYISESGAPMIGNIHYLVYPENSMAAARDAARLAGFPHEFKVSQRDKLFRALNDFQRARRRERTTEEKENFFKDYLVREFLGNASKPVLTKKRFIQELESGKSVDEIKATYRGWENKPLANWKSHYTQGTYSSKAMIEHNGDDSDLEKISKADAIDLLSSNIPPEEIYSAWPTSFSLGQLRSYLAHVTRGTYQEEAKHD